MDAGFSRRLFSSRRWRSIWMINCAIRNMPIVCPDTPATTPILRWHWATVSCESEIIYVWPCPMIHIFLQIIEARSQPNSQLFQHQALLALRDFSDAEASTRLHGLCRPRVCVCYFQLRKNSFWRVIVAAYYFVTNLFRYHSPRQMLYGFIFGISITFLFTLMHPSPSGILLFIFFLDFSIINL